MSAPDVRNWTRRNFAQAMLTGLMVAPRSLATAAAAAEPALKIRGLVMVPETLSLRDWPDRAKRAGLNTISLHHANSPEALLAFVKGDEGRAFLERCRKQGVHVEFDSHAMRDLVPRGLFAKDPNLFRLGEGGSRTADRNFCVHSAAAMETAVENALRYAKAFPTTTGRYYYWSDGCASWCRCPRCRELSDSDQPLMVANAIAKALRRDQPDAMVAHLACHASLPAPRKVAPGPGVFLQFAPPRRRYDIPYAQQTREDQVDSLWYLERNLEVFPAATAQALEYWLDVSLFSRGRKEPLPWSRDRFLADVKIYRSLGIGQIKTFVNDLDAEYVRKNGEPTPVDEYGAGLRAILDT